MKTTINGINGDRIPETLNECNSIRCATCAYHFLTPKCVGGGYDATTCPVRRLLNIIFRKEMFK